MAERALVVGTGLMGASFALAARRAELFEAIIGVDPHPAVARTLNVFDDLVMAVEDAPPVNAVLVAVPPSATGEVVAKVVDEQRDDVVICDVGSVKLPVIEAVRLAAGRMPPGFVPAHPMAGTHDAGAGAARADMFDGATVFITPVADTSEVAINRVTAWWRGCGAHVVSADPARHDQMVAITSHVPHLLAFAFMVQADREGGDLATYAGPGFRDFTRIAAADPGLWRDIVETNIEPVTTQLSKVADALGEIRSLLAARDFDRLETWLRAGQAARQRFERKLK